MYTLSNHYQCMYTGVSWSDGRCYLCDEQGYLEVCKNIHLYLYTYMYIYVYRYMYIHIYIYI
jgi:hypothetical protein